MSKPKIIFSILFLILAFYLLYRNGYFADFPFSPHADANKTGTNIVEKADAQVAKSDIVNYCTTNGGKADETGLKIWCWGDVEIPKYLGKKGTAFSNGELVIDSECYEKQVSKVGNLLKFRIEPEKPTVGSWCSNAYNMRAEVRTAPWKIDHEIGTEEWFGWSYTFGENYKIDLASQWMFFQVHEGTIGSNPIISIQIINENQFKGHDAGEIYVVNCAENPRPNEYVPTGIVPRADQTINVVVHVIWGDDTSGVLQVWVDDKLVYNKRTRTVFASNPVGGNAKWGIYKWPWRKKEGVRASIDQGITGVEAFMGPLRIITRKPGDPDYGEDSYADVAPR